MTGQHGERGTRRTGSSRGNGKKNFQRPAQIRHAAPRRCWQGEQKERPEMLKGCSSGWCCSDMPDSDFAFFLLPFFSGGLLLLLLLHRRKSRRKITASASYLKLPVRPPSRRLSIRPQCIVCDLALTPLPHIHNTSIHTSISHGVQDT